LSAVPVGYEAFHSRRRMGVTLLCFLLASSIAMGIAVYVDSYSMHQWNEYLDLGDVHMAIGGSLDLDSYVDDVRAIPAITRAAKMTMAFGNIIREENVTAGKSHYGEWGIFFAPDQELLDTYPDLITIDSGRLPQADDEIALQFRLNLYEDFELGDMLNLSVYSETDRVVEVVGFYTQQPVGGISPYGWAYGYESTGIIRENIIGPYYTDEAIFASIDWGPITPFSPQYSLSYVNGIDERIRQLDPLYDPPRHGSRLYIDNYVAGGISNYIMWVQYTRLGEVLRALSVFLLAGLVTFLAIRYNTNERRFERNMLISRGASPSDLDSAMTREILMLSAVSCVAGIPLGTLFSRIALTATGYFRFDVSKLYTEPFLVSLESVMISAVVGIALPMVALMCYRAVYSTKRSAEESTGKLGKAVRIFQFIKWDGLVVVLSLLLLIVLYSGGSSNLSISLLFVLQVVPLTLFLGVSSLAMKGLRAGAKVLSSVFSRVVGEIPSSIGVRRVGKSASSAGAAMMVLVLAVCLSWNSAIVDLSLPITETNQARLDIGADVSFALNDAKLGDWAEFVTNVSEHTQVESYELVSEMHLSLSADSSGVVTFLGTNPANYSSIGFSFDGRRLNESSIADLLAQLEGTPDGAIVTSDVAEIFDFRVGDVLMASDLDAYDPHTYAFRIVGIVEALPEMPEVEPDYYGPYPVDYIDPGVSLVGYRRVMINREYLSTLLNITSDTQNYLCVRTTPSGNGTKIGEDVLGIGGEGVLFDGVWDAVDTRVAQMVGQTTYTMERSIDTMLTVLTVGTIIGAFSLYAAEGVRARKREIALLRSIGADRVLIAASQAAEMTVLLFFGLVLLAGYGPLFLGTSVLSSIAGTITDSYLYPISAFIVVPWTTILLVLAFFFVMAFAFILVVAAVSSKIHLASALNATWAEAGPYGGDV
jgi:uncharacterized membrane protein